MILQIIFYMDVILTKIYFLQLIEILSHFLSGRCILFMTNTFCTFYVSYEIKYIFKSINYWSE